MTEGGRHGWYGAGGRSLSPSLAFKVGTFVGWLAREGVFPAMTSILSILFILSNQTE